MCFFFLRKTTRVVGACMLTMFLFTVCPVNVFAELVFQNERLKQAWELYQYAEPLEALSVIDEVLQNSSLSDEDVLNAYVLQGRCLVMDDRTDEALDSFRQVLDRQPDYLPEEADWTTPQLEVFRQAQAEVGSVPAQEVEAAETGQKTAWYKKPITWIAVGVVAVVAIVLVSGGEDEDLADFPDPPETPDEGK